MPAPTYLIKHPSSYLFRMNIPLDMQSKIGKKELRYSLRTGIVGEAKPKARLMAGLVQKLFRELRQEGHPVQQLSAEQIQAIINLQYSSQNLSGVALPSLTPELAYKSSLSRLRSARRAWHYLNDMLLWCS